MVSFLCDLHKRPTEFGIFFLSIEDMADFSFLAFVKNWITLRNAQQDCQFDVPNWLKFHL
jgi:hypothetical protein